MTQPAPRPRAVVLACAYTVAGSVLMLLQAGGALVDWGSIEVQERLDVVLPADVDASTRLDLRYLLYAPLLVAVATGVLGVFVALRRRSARLPLTVLAALGVLLLPLTVPVLDVTALVVAALVLGCALSLWTGEAARWLDGVDAPASAARAAVDPFDRRDATTAVERAAAPAATATLPDRDPAGADRPATRAVGPRPRPVEVAVWTALACSIVVGLLGLVTLLAVTVGADAYRAGLERPGLARDLAQATGTDPDELIRLMRVAASTWVVLSVLGGVAAVLALHRRRGGALALRAASIATIVVSVLFVPLGLLTAAAAVVTLVQLNHPDARRWFADAA